MIGTRLYLLARLKQFVATLSVRARSVWLRGRVIGSSWFVLSHLLTILAQAAAQTCPAEKLQTRIAEVDRDLQGELGRVRLHRLEELEDDIVVPREANSSADSPFRIFQVEQRRFFSENGKIFHQVPWGRTFSNYIVVSQDGEHVYRLAGFPTEAEENFKRLISDYRLPFSHSPNDAESRALFCARVVFGAEPKQWILGDEQARQAIANHFFFRPGEADRWWRDFRTKHPKIVLKITTVNSADGSYLTRLPFFWAPVETRITPEIRELRIQVSRDGSCQRAPELTSPVK